MKILLVNKFHYIRGGDSSYMFSLAELLRSHGHTVLFFSMNDPLNFPCDQEKYFVDNIDFVEVNKKKNLINGLKVLSRVFYSRQARERVSKLIDDTGPDIAHLNNIHFHITPSIIFEFRKRGIPVVWTLHDYQLICPNTNMISHSNICEACKGKRFIQCALKKCKKNSRTASIVASIEAIIHDYMNVTEAISCFISPSLFLRDKFYEFGWDKNKLLHIPYFLTPDKFINGEFNPGSYALFIGRLETYKGVGTLLKASRLLGGNVPVKIVGDGAERNSLVKMTADFKLNNVRFEGYLFGEKFKQALAGSRYVVVPSEWYENYPYVVMEAMAAGKPVIGSRIGGLPEMIDDGVTGFLFEPRNHRELAEKILTLETDEALRKKMGEEGKKSSTAFYNQEAHYREIIRLYSEMMEKRSSRQNIGRNGVDE